MTTHKMIVVGVLLVITIACSFMTFGFNSSDIPDNAVNENMYENDVYRFLIPEEWELKQSGGEYYDLGVEKDLAVDSGTKSGTSFTIASAPLDNGETLETRFALAYQEGPQIVEVSTSQFDLGTISGLEISYQRPWGEPWWQFRDIWLEKDSTVYVLSFQAYPNDFDSQAQTFDSILESFSFSIVN